MTVRMCTLLRNAVVTSFAGNLAGGTAEIRSGAMPATPDTAATGTVLASITLDGAWGTAAAGAITSLANTPIAAVASGTAGWVRILGSLVVLDGTIGITGTDYIVNTASIINGALVSFPSFSITLATN